ncbi:aromatic ring-opening dioxygenase LigA [Microbacterium sediminicola]
MTSTYGLPATRRAGTVMGLAGSLFVIAGTAAWVAVTRQLRDEKIIVPDNAPILAGKTVQDPVTAYVEALVIKGNAERSAGGRTFADISAALRDVEDGSDEQKKLRGQSAALSTAASLRTSLMTSVLAYGVSALVAGLGALFVIVGSQLRRA